MTDTMQHCYLVEGNGLWLQSYVIVFAPDEAAAKAAALPLLLSVETKNQLEWLKVREIPQTGATLVWNGDY